MASSAKPNIEVATIKPSDPDSSGELFTTRGTHLVTLNTSTVELLKFAYGVSSRQLIGDHPSWLDHDKFDIDALADVPGQPGNEQMQHMVRQLLTTRFHLTYHREQREFPVYALTLIKAGPKLTTTTRQPSDSTDIFGSNGELTVRNASMSDFATGLSRGLADRPVIDRTGLTSRFDFQLKWSFDKPTTPDPNAPPNLFGALEQELGLKLIPTKAPIEVLVIDRIEHPSPN